MDFIELAEKRYSCRRYSDKPVGQEKIEKILTAARAAPSAKNNQPCHVWVVKSKEGLEKMDECSPCIYKAPVVLVVGYKPASAWVREDGRNYGDIDASIMGTHILLEAEEQGLGSVWVGMFSPEKIHALFPETAGFEITALFPLGYKAESSVPIPWHFSRRAIKDFTTEL